VPALILAALASCGNGDRESAAATPAAPHAAFAAPATGRVADVWALGDGSVAGSASARRVAAMVAHARPELFLYLGDVYPSGSAQDYRTYDSLYGRLARRTAPTLGNHEAPNRAKGYAPYWARELGRPMPRWYAFRAGGWNIISLDSEVGGPLVRRQARWLRSKVKGRGDCRLAFWHRPRYSAGLHGDASDTAPLWNALAGRARLVLNGHDHDLQQLRRRDGITELVAGAGGNERYPLRRDTRLEWGTAKSFGALKLRLSAGHASWAFVDERGRTLHRGAARCAPS
jgi:hypothetical protein